ncbi:MAG: hypothetical protein ACRD8O_02260 [Bryobacteraceae bacterium]
MNCDEAREVLLGGAESAAFHEHLEDCAACREDAAMWRQLGSLPEELPSPMLRKRFQTMLAAGQGHRWSPMLIAAQAAAAAVIFVAGWVLGQSRAQDAPPPRTDVPELRAEVKSLREMVALSLMQQSSASERLRGVNFSTRVDGPDAEVLSALLDTLRADPIVDVRLAAVDALRRYSRDANVRRGVAQALAAPQSPLVQMALIDLLVEMGERQGVPVLRNVGQEGSYDSAVRERARSALGELRAKGVQ